MKMMLIEPAKKPKSFESVDFTEAEWKAADKKGALRVPFVTAAEAVQNSKGLYQMVPEKDTLEVEVKGLKDPDEMDAQEIVQELTMWGKPPQKKMPRQKAVDFIRKLRADAADLITDDE